MLSAMDSSFPTTPLLCKSPTTTSSSSSSEADDSSPTTSMRFTRIQLHKPPISNSASHRLLEVISGHVGSVSCLALSGEFLLSASQGKDIIVWQQPDLRLFTKFGQGDGSVKALVTVGNRVFTAHQDSRIRVWKISRSSENVFKKVNTLPTTKDYLGKFMKQSNYVQTRRHHKKLWIEHADSISCLAASNGFIYSGSWDKTLKVWRMSDLRCIESIKAHDDAINALAVTGRMGLKNLVLSASADGKIKVWGKEKEGSHELRAILEGHREVSMNSMAVCEEDRVVYGGGSDGYLMGWRGEEDGVGWKLVCEVKAHEMSVLSVCRKGEIVCSGSADKTIGIWRRGGDGGLCRAGIISGHGGPVKCLQASGTWVGSGFLVYSGSLDKSIRVWWVASDEAKEKKPLDWVPPLLGR